MRSQTTLSRADIDRLVAVYIDGVARRDREFESWQPRRPSDEGKFRRQSQIDVYSDLASSVMDGRRSRAGVVSAEVLAATAEEAGIDIEGGLDAHLAEDALADALARYYESRAEYLRREGDVGVSNGLARFLRSLLGKLEPRQRHESGVTRDYDCSRQPNPDLRVEVPVATAIRTDAVTSSTEFVAKAPPAAESQASNEKAHEATVAGGAERFGKFWDEFVQTKLDIRKDWKPSRRPELLSTRRLWIWIVGDVPPSECGSELMRKFHDSYQPA